MRLVDGSIRNTRFTRKRFNPAAREAVDNHLHHSLLLIYHIPSIIASIMEWVRALRAVRLLTGWWIAGMCCVLGSAGLANQVQNPYFTGTTNTATSWTTSVTTYTTFNSALSAGAPAAVSSGGSTEFQGGCVGAACLTYPLHSGVTSGAQQTVATTAGQNYAISFWTFFSTANNATVEIDVYWGSTKIYAEQPMSRPQVGRSTRSV